MAHLRDRQYLPHRIDRAIPAVADLRVHAALKQIVKVAHQLGVSLRARKKKSKVGKG
jgi:hypothetical protein